MAPAWVCVDGSQTATEQWTTDFMDGTQCLHFHPSIMQQTGYNCFAMHNHTYDTYTARGFPFSFRQGYGEKDTENSRESTAEVK